MILTIYIVEPQWGFLRLWHRFVPRKDSIGLATNKAPVDSRHVVLLEEREDGLEIASIATCHILGADHRAVILTERVDTLAMDVGVAIVVVGDDIGVSQLEVVEFGTLHKPYAYSERLAHLAFACPSEDIAQ